MLTFDRKVVEPLVHELTLKSRSLISIMARGSWPQLIAVALYCIKLFLGGELRGGGTSGDL